jgi:hypothetical protein
VGFVPVSQLDAPRHFSGEQWLFPSVFANDQCRSVYEVAQYRESMFQFGSILSISPMISKYIHFHISQNRKHG